MFISDINEKDLKKQKKHYIKTSIVYAAITLLCIITDNIYAIFGHGVRSDYMSYMFLYPLIGGTVFFLILLFAAPKVKFYKNYRAFYNLYNSGIALLSVGSLYSGILEIAGTNSSFSNIFRISGIIFIIISLIILAKILFTHFVKLRPHLS